MNKLPETKGRLHSLDIAKGILILIVVLHHMPMVAEAMNIHGDFVYQ